jgi:16S rRNA (adenine1518-N6/adenine1519-N6)-dimethyltransferase
VEIDRGLEPVLREALAGHENVQLVWGDALRVDIDALVPPPTKLVANLPYNVATPLIVESLEHARSLEHWCVMVQREVADRFFARPRTKAYGAVSVLVQLTARRTGFHVVPPTVFRPRPRVASALVAFERAPVAAIADVRPVVEAAFAHRRKTLPNALDMSGLTDRTRAEQALASIGHSSSTRAEELEPKDFVRLVELLR